ncbi:restriction endonuclease subunit S [Mesorhizobium sp. GbtcB19]|uniref:restriction endonuclease subunit S n=1 Tax=Mesorhizobium sp. GbtcB19 TaxID=2824764 RepID=UPI001C2F8896|nr:restriction endonuclease subunit S [Mesorhizobium sp. GbtcB19]
MNAERLLAHYEKIADAPDAIGGLRRFILDLAVRGKLVPPDASEEAVEGFRKPTDPAAPFGLPSNWKWIEIGDQLDLLNGMAFKPTDWSREGLRIVRIQNLNNPDAPFNFCNPEMARERSLIDNGSFLVSWSGTPGTSFGAFIWDRGPAVLNQHIFRCDFKTKAFVAAYLRLAINGRLDEMIAKAHGGVGLQHITKGKLEALLIPLPPLAEQRRIVAKVDELMALCDRLEAAQAGREAARDRVTAASLARLNTPDPETFHIDARFALKVLPTLTTRPDQIKTLRQTILNLAVRGKLVPQDSTDEPALELHTFDEPELTGRLGFEIPTSWRWVRVENVADARLGKMLDKAKNKGRPYPYLRNTNVHWFDIRLDDLKTIPLDDAEFEGYRLKDGDVLICEGGHGIGRTAVWRGGPENFIFQKALHRVRPGARLDPDFFAQCCFVYFDSGIMQTYFTGVGIPHFTGRALSKLVFPLPPLAEQRRIVAKVDALMALCDRLEVSLTETAATRRRLLDALLAEALAPAEDRELEAAE